MIQRLVTRIVAVAVVASLTACGGGDGGSGGATNAAPERLTAQKQREVRRSQTAIVAYCNRFARSALSGRGAPPPAAQERAVAAVDTLIALARGKPDAIYRTGVDMRLLLGDTAEDLEGSNCDERLVARLDQALATLPRREP
jgi:hypothetical protein